MRRSIVAGNWKMHGSKAMVADLLGQVIQALDNFDAADVICIPPFPYLDQVAKICDTTSIKWGAQSLSVHQEGAYTGEVSASMLRDFACYAVLVGHSERRQYHQESNETVAAQFKQAQQQSILPILCVGETAQEREQSQTEAVIAAQLDAVLASCNIEQMANAVIAYEPVWAIGTGVTATPEQAQTVHRFIREKLTTLHPEVAQNVSILYGGSVKSKNAASLFAMPDIDGGLIGGASLVAQEFIEIVKCIK